MIGMAAGLMGGGGGGPSTSVASSATSGDAGIGNSLSSGGIGTIRIKGGGMVTIALALFALFLLLRGR